MILKPNLLATVIAGGLLTTTPSWAQTNHPSNAIEEVLVTAQKRSQNILDVPLTISSLSGDTLQTLGINQFDEISELIPGLVVQQQSINNNGYVIRGITSDDGSAPSAARVSVYLNGVDVSRSRGSYFEPYDMERVEVVKGPQATLFGTAASIGAISFITNKPQREFAAELHSSAGNYGLFEVGGFITGGSDWLQGRLAFLSRERDGYVKNRSSEADLNGFERTAIRPGLRFTPNDQFTLDLIYNYEKADDPGTAFSSHDALFTDQLALSVPNESNLGMANVGVERETNDLNLTSQWQINAQWQLTYIGAYRDHDSLEAFDADGTAYEFLNFAEQADGRQNSHELRVNFSGDRVTGFAGLSHFSEQAKQTVPFTTEEGLFLSCIGQAAVLGITQCDPGTTQFVTTLIPALPVQNAIPYQSYYRNGADNQAESLFADATLAISDRVELTLGARYVDEKRRSSYASDVPPSFFATLLTGQPTDLFGGGIYNTSGTKLNDELTNSSLLPRANLRWQITPQLNGYATIAKGERAEVLELASGSAAITPAEKITNYEIGLKGSNTTNSINYSLALFYQDYQNFQVNVIDEATGLLHSENAGNATNNGFEAEITWLANHYFTVIANLALIDAGIDDDASNGEFAGNQFRLQPETSGALALLWHYPIANNLELNGSANYSYRSEVYFDIENNFKESAVGLLDLRLGMATQDGNWSAALFIDNATDEEYIIDAGNTGNAFGFATYIEGAPLMYGLELRKHFQ
ncbi:TonB-dependent receptor [Halioxenophilus sp. WMMB6]|uniref:TonB-dependent receptor n=1 Tax=Halioxenophilus sp. WMMB6 TaxID=3073815 RepID=UPI00295E8C7E|nr:TonB-dependent receptor [Halioxenophilus sp. WMMB6]